MWGREIADSGLQLERIFRMVARKGSIVEVAGNSTGVINKPHPLLLLGIVYQNRTDLVHVRTRSTRPSKLYLLPQKPETSSESHKVTFNFGSQLEPRAQTRRRPRAPGPARPCDRRRDGRRGNATPQW